MPRTIIPPILSDRPSERVALAQRAGLDAAREPAHPLLRRAVCERFGRHASAGLPLQPVVADRGGRAQRLLDVSGLEDVTRALGVVRPHAGQAVGLQLQPHGRRMAAAPPRYRLSAGGSSFRISFTFASSTLKVRPARSSSNSIDTRESRSPQPRLSASVISMSVSSQSRMGTPNSRPTAVARLTSLWARRSAKDGGSYLFCRKLSPRRSYRRWRPLAPLRTAFQSAAGSSPALAPIAKTSASAVCTA